MFWKIYWRIQRKKSKVNLSLINITIKSNGTPTEGQPLKNFVVKSGVMGTDSAKLAIVIDTTSLSIEQVKEEVKQIILNKKEEK